MDADYKAESEVATVLLNLIVGELADVQGAAAALCRPPAVSSHLRSSAFICGEFLLSHQG